MSDTEKKVESVEEQKNPANRDAAPAEAPTLKNDAEDLGAPVVKPTDSNPDATKKIKKVSDQVNKDANDGSLPNDQKPSSMKKEEKEEVEEMANMNAMKMKKLVNFVDKKEVKKESAEVEIDLSDDVKALVSSDADLSEELKIKQLQFLKLLLRQELRNKQKSLRHNTKKNFHLKKKQ